MRRRAASQAWTLSRVHRVLRPLRTKVAALSASLKKERRSGIRFSTTAPTPTPTRRPPLRRTYQARRKRKRGSDDSEDDGGQYIPEPEKPRPAKIKQPKPERRWSPEVLERMSAVVDAFRVLADVVYDEQMEAEPGQDNMLKLRDLCVRSLATDIEPSAIAAAGPSHDDSDDDGELIDKFQKPTEVIAVSSDTEQWDEHPCDSDDAFAAIPTPKYTNRHQIRSPIKTRRRSLGLRRPLPPDSSGDEYQDPAGQPRRNAARRARPSFDWNWGDSDSESSEPAFSDSDSDKGDESDPEEESDFDWTRYNGSYHPHDRLPGGRASGEAKSRRATNQSSSIGTRNVPRRKDPDEENRRDALEARPARAQNRVVPAPAPAVKRQRLVVEIPIYKKRPTKRSSSVTSSEPRTVLGNHNAPRRQSGTNKPKMQLYISPPRRKPTPTAREITTSTLERLCNQFVQLSSDDDRDMVVDLVEDSQDEVEDTCIERRMAMPSSDDMNLFEIVTPAPRKVRPRPSFR
ncbi:hypothetical protein RSOLAG22IIIB_12717 [Rhizoctonia solani]|uniref:Uncharacterized protein n=1 Tax=Rhizoctonia solani TaxID=456999 RepID=A0A0K6GFJ4_9AGAM|nr:hypothetical protein RSOLAG22IIIB_12717 [Rhizoctonia solani]